MFLYCPAFAQHAQLIMPLCNFISSFVSSLASAVTRASKRAAGASSGPPAKMPKLIPLARSSDSVRMVNEASAPLVAR